MTSKCPVCGVVAREEGGAAALEERDWYRAELKEAVELLQEWEYECDYSEFGQMLVDTRKFLTRERARPLPGMEETP